MADRIMLIRHSEKPVPGEVRGVAADGREDPTSLSVRGWQRAGALAVLFAAPPAPLARPDHLFACRPDPKSARSLRTLEPLAARLALPIGTGWGDDGEAGLADAALACPGTVLVAWKHAGLPVLARRLLGRGNGVPDAWPQDRFDLLWLLERTGGGWRFVQQGQCLLDGDSAASI